MRSILFIGSLILSTVATAAPKHAIYDYAVVEHVKRVYEPATTHTYYKNCHSDAHRTDSAATTFIGAVIGGAIGNAMGQNSSHKKLSTLAGAALGGSLAHDIAQRHNPYTRCAVTMTSKPKFIGYKVHYRYKGQRFHTMMAKRPGKKIKVKIQVTPAFKRG